jgi:hypothetical protein
MWHDIHTKFREDWLRCSEIVRKGYTQKAKSSYKPILCFKNKDPRLKWEFRS